MSTTIAIRLKVVTVTAIPRVFKDTCAKRIFEKKAMKKKKEMANMPAPTGGDWRIGTRRLKP
ncbi:hypothetical protein [Desulfosporosinus acidiphilus]|uniref:hypothetical protein n=1 Tax=Desulfosporosinus acidiphilus TaxID=885581 RepID=UPI00030EE9F6|nr:hypothetical protein [Desulfosporosinus acidiphilus]